jgi:hypothetical protein
MDTVTRRNDSCRTKRAPVLVEVSRRIDRQEWASYVEARDYEGLEAFILRNLMEIR